MERPRLSRYYCRANYHKRCAYSEKEMLLPLSLLSMISLVRSKKDAGERIFLHFLPPVLKKDVILMLKMYDFHARCMNDLPLKSAWVLLVRSGLSASVKLQNSDSLLHFIRRYREFIDIDCVVAHVKNILELDLIIIRYIIAEVGDFVILNNILILSGFYANREVMKLCLDEGARDLIMCRRAAVLGGHDYFYNDLIFESRDPSLRDRFKHTVHYRVYKHGRSCKSVNCRSLTKNMYKIRQFMRAGISTRCVAIENIECLRTPLGRWHNQNMFHFLSCTPSHMLIPEMYIARKMFETVLKELLHDTDDVMPGEILCNEYDG